MRSVRDGTPNFSGPGLCVTCRHSHIMKGHTSENVTLCQASGVSQFRVFKPVVECNEYENKTIPPLWEMEKVAWKFSVDHNNKPMGFLTPKKWKEKYGDSE